MIRVQEKSTAQKSEFAYDGLSRMTVRKEYASATATPSEVRYLWCGDKICQSRDGQDNIVSRYYTEGELQGSMALYYVKDHLGSITDVVSAQGKPLGQLDYGPYGEQEKARGRLTDFRYAGMLYHPNSGYYFTHYRVYDPETGRWLSRDPIGENGGLNLYSYVGGNPISLIDPDGLMGQGSGAGRGGAVASKGTPNPSPTQSIVPQRCANGDFNCAAGLPPDQPPSPRSECNIKCNFKYQFICTGAAVGVGALTTPLGGAAAGGVCILVKAYVCDQASCCNAK